MAGEQPRENEMWKMAADIQSAMFAEDSKPLTAWNVNSAAETASNRELLYHSTSTEMPNQSHGGLIYGPSPSSSGWNSMDNTGLGIPRSAELSHLMDIDVGFDSSYLSFTQCLQSGLRMDATDYTSLSRSLGIGRDSHFPDYNANSNQLSSDDIAQSSHTPFDFGSSLVEAGEHMGDAPNVPTTPNSSLSSSSAEGNEEATAASAKEPAATPQTDQPDQAPAAAAADQDQESQDNPSADSKKVSKPRKKGQKRNREPRFAFMTKSDVDHLEDGYRWRKYGQKAVKNSPFPRSYYRCTNTKCSVKKRVERSFEDPSVVITTYEGQHTHQSPALLRSSGGPGVGGGGGAGPGPGSDHALHASTSSFTQSPFDFPLQMMVHVPPRTNTTVFDHIHHQQQQQQQRGVPSPHPALQRSQPAPNLPDHGLLEDIFSSGMRKLS